MDKKRGRPKLGKKNAKLVTLQIRLTEHELRQLKKIAGRDGNKKASQWAREKLLALLASA
jgi:hypothetical protein